MFWARLREDSELAIITAFAGCAMVGIVPFAIYRFASGNPLAGFVDLSIAGSICLAVGHAWRSGDRRRASLLLAIINTVGCLASATVLGPPGLYWMYPALLGNFLLLGRNTASLVTACALLFLTVQGKAYDTPQQLAMFLVSASVASLIAFVFAFRTQTQRDELQLLATLDPLTGARNRRAMEEDLAEAVQRYEREGQKFGLAMLDLDHFKRINDQLRHEAGDNVLVDFAKLLVLHTRKADRCYRFGGEEFVLLIPIPDAGALAEIDPSLRLRVEQELRVGGDPVTVSIGAASLRPGEDWPDRLARADAALYRAKREGRNRTVIDIDGVKASA
jgi:diguanylate cyclase (GGDEF)-like protein